MKKNDDLTTAESQGGDQPLDRLFRVMELMASVRTPARLIDLARMLDMSQSTVYRYVRSLCRLGYAYCDESTGCYALTWKICSLSGNIRNNLVLRSIVDPYLNSLSNTLNVSSCLVVMDGIRTTYLDYIDNPVPSRSGTIRIGHNAPIHTSGSGKVLLSAMPRAEVSRIIGSVGLIALTPHTITDEEKFFDELARVQETGYAIDDEECEAGYRCVSVPVYDYSKTVAAAISVFDIVEEMPHDRIGNVIIPALREASALISHRLGYTP